MHHLFWETLGHLTGHHSKMLQPRTECRLFEVGLKKGWFSLSWIYLWELCIGLYLFWSKSDFVSTVSTRNVPTLETERVTEQILTPVCGVPSLVHTLQMVSKSWSKCSHDFGRSISLETLLYRGDTVVGSSPSQFTSEFSNPRALPAVKAATFSQLFPWNCSGFQRMFHLLSGKRTFLNVKLCRVLKKFPFPRVIFIWEWTTSISTGAISWMFPEGLQSVKMTHNEIHRSVFINWLQGLRKHSRNWPCIANFHWGDTWILWGRQLRVHDSHWCSTKDEKKV